MAVDVIIDPSSGQIYWNDAAGSGTQTIAISGNATNAINIVGYSNFFSPGGGGLGTQILATFTDSATSTFTPGTNAYDLGSSSLRWNFYGTGGNFTGAISTTSSTASTSSTTGALIVSGGAGIAKTSYFGQSVVIQGTTASSSTTTGALVVTGGVGIGGRLYVGTASTGASESTVIAAFARSATSDATVVIQNTSSVALAAAKLSFRDHAAAVEAAIRFYNTSNPTSYNNLLEISSPANVYYSAGSGSSFEHSFINGYGVRLQQTTASTASTNGALVVTGGAGIAKTSYFGQSVVIQGSTASGSTTTGALTVSGGVGIGGSLNVFGTIDVSNNIEVLSQKEVRFFNSANTFYTGLKAGSSSANVTFTLPIADGSANQVLYTNGSAALGWTTIASAITTLNGLTASTQTFATGTSGTDFNISSSTSTHTFNIPYAGAASTGLVTTQAQTIAGAKTFSGNTIISSSTASTNTTTGALVVTGGVGIGGSLNVGNSSVADVIIYNTDYTSSANLNLRTGTGASLIGAVIGFNSTELKIQNNFRTITNYADVFQFYATNLDDYQLIISSAGATFYNTTASTSSTTGALRLQGGAGIAKTSYFGQDLKIQGTTSSTGFSTGALTVTGGVGIGGSLYVNDESLFRQSSTSKSALKVSGANRDNNGIFEVTSVDGGSFKIVNNFGSSYGIMMSLTPSSATAPYAFGINKADSNNAVGIDVSNMVFTMNRGMALRIYESTGNFYFGLKYTGSGNTTYTWPSVDGTSGQVLYTNGSAALGWTTPSGSASGSSTWVQYNQGGAFGATSAFTFVPSTGLLSASNLASTNSQPNEGGEITLSQPSSGTALTTTVTIDIYQNRIRFFESGGANRGAYIDFTSCNNGAGTNLLVGSGASGLTSLNGLTASTQTFATGTSGTDFNISSGTSTHTFNIPYAGSGATGLVTTQAQTIAGVKTFSSQTIISDTTASTTTATGALLVYGGLGVTGQINAASLQTSGNAVISGNLTFNGVGVFGNATSDTINSLARYISDILPSADNSYDLGNNSLGWRNFRVSGVGTIASLAVTSSTVSTSSTTGALRVSGGVGIALTSYFGQDVKILGSTASTSSYTGSLTVAGGVGISGGLYIGVDAPNVFGSEAIGIGGSNAQITLKNTYNGPDSKATQIVFINNGDFLGSIGIGQTYDTSPNQLTINNEYDINYYAYGTNSIHKFTSPLDIELTIGGTGVSVLNTTASTSTTTGGLTVAGGAGIAKTSYFGQDLKIQGTTASTNTTTGALTVSGGVGIGGSLWTSTSNLASVSGVTLNNGTITGTLSGTATSAQVLATTTDTSSTLYLLGSRSSTGFGGTAVYVDTNISFSGSTITASLTGTATTATAAIGVNVSNAATNSTHYIRFSPTATGTGLATSTNTSLTYNPSTNILSATTFSGSFSGSLTGTASIATSSINSATTTDTTSTLYLLGSRSSTGFAGTALYVDSSISILGSQVTAGVWGGTAISAVNGGTGQVSYTIGDILYASSTTALSKLSAGTAGSVLASGGAGAAPYWKVDATGGGGGTVAAPTAASLVAYYPGTGASVASYNRVEINTATASMELTAQSSLPALVVNAVNGSVVDSVEFKSSFGDVYWALSNTTQSLKSLNGGILKIDGSGIITVTAPGSLTFYNSAETFYTSFIGAATANTTYTLPPASPATGTSVLQSNTAGVLSWVPMSAGGGSGTVTSGTAGSVAYYTGSGTTVGGAPGFTYTTSGTASTINVFGGGAIGTTIFTVQATSSTSVRVGIGTNLPQYELEIVGEISATNKSFVIDHPTKPGKKLRYGSLEGPENGVYVRGELKDSNIIETPDHWEGLVYPDSFTVTLTPIGRFSHLYVEKIEDYKVFIADAYMNPIHCYYTVWAERKDIPKLITEY